MSWREIIKRFDAALAELGDEELREFSRRVSRRYHAPLCDDEFPIVAAETDCHRNALRAPDYWAEREAQIEIANDIIINDRSGE